MLTIYAVAYVNMALLFFVAAVTDVRTQWRIIHRMYVRMSMYASELECK